MDEKERRVSSSEPGSPREALDAKAIEHDPGAVEAGGSKEEKDSSSRDSEDLTRTPSRPAIPMPLYREIPFVALVCCGQLFTQATLSQAIAILSYISPTFGGLSYGELSWMPAAFSLTTGTFILISGRVGDMIGHKTLFIGGWVWMALATLLAGLSALSHQQIFFDVCRALQGMASAMLMPSSLAILGSTYPPGPRKSMVFALFAATAPNGALIGAAFASIFAQFTWWPWAFWTSAIICAAIAIMSFWIIPDPEDDSSSVGAQTFDWAGAATGVTGLILFNVAWNQAPIVGWQTPYCIVLLILGLLFLGIFLWVELRVNQPLLPVRGLGAEVGFVLGCVSLGWSSFGIWLIYFWQINEQLRGATPLLATAYMTPAGIGGLVASLLTGYLMTRIRPELIMVAALVFFCLGNTLLATMSVDQIYWAETFLAALLTPFGMDMSFPASTLILSNAVPKRQQGIAASLVATVVNYSVSIGFGLGATVESRVNPGIQQAKLLQGYRSALYTGIGLAGSGIVLSIIFVIYSARKRKTTSKS